MDLQEHLLIMIKDISTSQDPPASSKSPAMSSFFETVLDAFKFKRFQPNLKHRVKSRHEHGQKFALEAEVKIETEKNFLLTLGLRLSLTSKDPNEMNRDWGVCRKKRSHVNQD